MFAKLELKDGFRRVGKIRAPHGIRGELFLISFSKNFDWLGDISKASLVTKEKDESGKLQEVVHQFSIKKSKPHKVGYILRLEGLDSRTEAEAYTGALFQIPEDIFQKNESEHYYLLKLEGFSVKFANLEPEGIVVGFAHNGAQDLLIVRLDSKEVSIPYVQDFILDLNFEEKFILLDVPQDLLEL